MAIPKWVLTIGVRDSERKLATMTMFNNGALYSDALSAVQLVAAALSAGLTQGVVAYVKVESTDDVDPSVPSGNVDNEIKSLWTFNNDDGKAYQVSIPAFQRSYLNVNSDTVNLTNPDVVDFVAAMLAAGMCDSRAVPLANVRSALEHFTRRQRS